MILQDSGARDTDDILTVLNAPIDNADINQDIHTLRITKKIIIIPGSSYVATEDSSASIVNILKAFGLENNPNIICTDYTKWLNFVKNPADQKNLILCY